MTLWSAHREFVLPVLINLLRTSRFSNLQRKILEVCNTTESELVDTVVYVYEYAQCLKPYAVEWLERNRERLSRCAPPNHAATRALDILKRLDAEREREWSERTSENARIRIFQAIEAADSVAVRRESAEDRESTLRSFLMTESPKQESTIRFAVQTLIDLGHTGFDILVSCLDELEGRSKNWAYTPIIRYILEFGSWIGVQSLLRHMQHGKGDMAYVQGQLHRMLLVNPKAFPEDALRSIARLSLTRTTMEYTGILAGASDLDFVDDLSKPKKAKVEHSVTSNALVNAASEELAKRGIALTETTRQRSHS